MAPTVTGFIVQATGTFVPALLVAGGFKVDFVKPPSRATRLNNVVARIKLDKVI